VPRLGRALAAAAGAALALAAGALAHGGVAGFTSTLTDVRPAVDGLDLRVLDGDDRLQLTNETGETVVVTGYDGEPYLRFAGGEVFRNARSPATYLNEERYGKAKVPAEAKEGAAPRWERVSRTPTFEWHDHRIHWMSPILPPQVRRAEDEAHHVFDWTVPITVGGTEVELRGSLDYEPPPPSRFRPVLIVPLAAVAVLGAAFWWRRRRVAAAAA
jgi:MYXO-CTERM domain-containing protein